MQDKVPDPASAWESLAPKSQTPPSTYQPFAHSQLRESEWRWGWSRWIGVHYGPIPVGLIIGIPLLLLLWH